MNRFRHVLLFSAVLLLFAACDRGVPMATNPDQLPAPESAQVATFGGGCFWCVEEVFHQTAGVYSAVSGYMGGRAETANYETVGRGRTNHAEVVQVHFDPEVIPYDELLDVFFLLHDPTQLNRQGPDRGRQYRSVIFAHNDLQKLAAIESIRRMNEERKFGRDVLTALADAPEFYPAESYHQNFARSNPGNGYLRSHLYPKLRKFEMLVPGGSKGVADDVDVKGSHPRR